MLRSKQVKNGTDRTGRITSVLVVGWLILGWSRPAFPDDGRHLKLAPIRFGSSVGGNVGYTYLSNNFGTNRNSLQALGLDVNYQARANSFFWQPWFAQVSAGLRIDFTTTTTRSSSTYNNNAGNTNFGDYATLNLLQYSRFPFKAHVFSGYNHASGTANNINSDYKNSGYDLSQTYKNRSGDFSGFALYTHTKGGRTDIGTEDNFDTFDLTLSGQPNSNQSYNIVGAIKHRSRPLQDISTKTNALNANHSYRPNSSFSVASLVNLINTNNTSNPGQITMQQNDYNSQQISSYASWRPILSALTVTSSVRLIKTDQSSINNTSSSTSFRFDESNFNLGANYAWSRLLRTYGSVNVNDRDNLQTITTNAALTAQKAFGDIDVVNLGGFRYSRYAGASISNTSVTTNDNSQTTPGSSNTTTTTSDQSLGGNLGHALSKSSNLGGGNMTTRLYQRLSGVITTLHSPVWRLNSGGSVAWRSSQGRGNTNLSLNATDSRQLTGYEYYSQLITLQANRYVNLLRHQSLTGNLTVQTSRTGNSSDSTPFVTTPTADLQYVNDRLFAIKNLTLTSTLNLVGSQIVLSQNSDPLNLSNGNNARISWENKMEYRIGKLQLKLYSKIAEINSVRQTSIYFNMLRTF
jgi:hypothetical protein